VEEEGGRRAGLALYTKVVDRANAQEPGTGRTQTPMGSDPDFKTLRVETKRYWGQTPVSKWCEVKGNANQPVLA